MPCGVWGQFCFLSENSVYRRDLGQYRSNTEEAHFGKISGINVYSLLLISGKNRVLFDEIVSCNHP